MKKRIIPCLDVKDGRVVKGVQFKGLRDIGDPVALAAYYNAELADELVFLDISRTENGHHIIEETASKLFIPLTIGGGISSTDDISTLLKHGADKVSLNSSALRNPSLVKEASEKFGSQCICIAVDAKWEDERNDWFCYTHGGKQPTDIRVLDWVRQVEYLGAGELLVTSMDYDGVKQGFDHQLLNQINTVVSIPVIASGGGGNAQHFVDLFQQTNVSAGLAASIFHDKETTIGAVKTYLKDKGVDVRWH